MRIKIFSRSGREWVALSAEARKLDSVEDETRDLYRRFEEHLGALGLSLENTLRSRIWALDRDARYRATAERSKILTGRARAATSSLIAPDYFDSRARVALDLIAVRPSHPETARNPVEFAPARNYLHYLSYDSLVAFSGVTSDRDSLEQQVPQILDQLERSLSECGLSWSNVVQASFFLHQSQKLPELKAALERDRTPRISACEFHFVAGYAGERSLLEVEITAEAQ